MVKNPWLKNWNLSNPQKHIDKDGQTSLMEKLKPIQLPKNIDKDGQTSLMEKLKPIQPPKDIKIKDGQKSLIEKLKPIQPQKNIKINMVKKCQKSPWFQPVDVQTQPIYGASRSRSAPACGPCVLARGPAPSPRPGESV